MTAPGWEVRLPVPGDRDRFREAKMLTLAADLPFAEQPVIETDTGLITSQCQKLEAGVSKRIGKYDGVSHGRAPVSRMR